MLCSPIVRAENPENPEDHGQNQAGEAERRESGASAFDLTQRASCGFFLKELVISALLVSFNDLSAAGGDTPVLSNLSLEQLSQIKIVTASKREQLVENVPAAVDVAVHTVDLEARHTLTSWDRNKLDVGLDYRLVADKWGDRFFNARPVQETTQLMGGGASRMNCGF
jgi:hypothetical protein